MLVSAHIPSYSANSVNVMKMAEALADEGYAVTLIARTKDNYKQNKFIDSLFEYYAVKQNFDIQLNGVQNLWLYYVYVFINLLIKKPTFVYTRDIGIALITSVARFNTVYHCHKIIGGQKKKLIKHIFKMKHFKAFTVVSEGLKSHYINKYSLSDKDVKIISNGVDLKRFTPVLSKVEARNLCDLKSDIKIICYVGHLYEGRGIDLLLNLSERFTGYIFIIVGGLEEDVDKWKLKAGNNVFFKGFVPNNVVPLYLFSADIIVMPYSNKIGIYQGGITTGEIIRPIKLFEYMAACRPIIASDLPGIREVLNDDSAYFAQANDLYSWEQAIKAIEDNPEQALKVSEKARRDVMEYSFEIIAKKIRNIVEQW